MNDLKLVDIPDRPTRQWRSLILYRHKLIERRTAMHLKYDEASDALAVFYVFTLRFS